MRNSLLTRNARPQGPVEYAVTKCEKLVDTNGAGDAFCGGFLAAKMQVYINPARAFQNIPEQSRTL